MISTSYVNSADYAQIHITVKSDGKTSRITLKWLNIAISNAKRTLLDIPQNQRKISSKLPQRILL